MKSTIALLSLAAGALAGGVTSAIAPKASAPAGCSAAYSGQFEITVAVVQNTKRDEPVSSRPTPSPHHCPLSPANNTSAST